jgi:hypothetical protein
MISLNDGQLKSVTTAVQVPYEKRAQFLERIAAMLALRGRSNFTDGDVDEVVKVACVGPDWCTKARREGAATATLLLLVLLVAHDLLAVDFAARW